MKSVKIFALGLLFVMFAACNKEEKDPPAMRLVSRVEIYRTASGSVENDQTFEYRYDEQNRIMETIIADKFGNPVNSVVNYPAENIMAVGGYTYTLNSDASIASWSEGEKLKGTCTYTNGYLQKMVSFSEIITIDNTTIPFSNAYTYTWENGNITTGVMELSFYTDPPDIYTTTLFFEYSTQNKPSSIDFSRFHIGAPLVWYGKSALNLPSKITNKGDGFDEQITIYRYETDLQGYPIKIFIRENDGDEELATVIEYKNSLLSGKEIEQG